ncbi:MAG: phosphoribosylformimino-5-aminoimidazole carboxamide ribotide isomerase [Lachnospiraceae bacterium]|nr:phosphoribosylformimino-5-aminoimidazole carboxamide ribotide isomerase [Lachnospiraceae bacterium]
MKFRPCIDIHNGEVKQIVGGSLLDEGNKATENFVSKQDAAYFSRLYADNDLKGGHVILLNPSGSEYYEKTKEQALLALRENPGFLQIGGGINADNAKEFLEAGASHVIVTSYVFKDGRLNWEALQNMVSAVGKDKLVLDLSCRKKGDSYYIVTDRWQKFTEFVLSKELICELSSSCDEFLVHATDVEGLSRGIEENVASILKDSPIPVTYAGGVHSFEDLDKLRELGNNRVDVTIGSALDIFGGSMKFEDVLSYMNK